MQRALTPGNQPHVDLLDRCAGVTDDPGRAVAIEVALAGSLMLCQGEGCLYEDICDFCHGHFDMDAPVDQPCPIEMVYVRDLYTGYCEEINPEKTSQSLMLLIKELVTIELFLYRSTRMLSIDGAHVENVDVGYDSQSNTTISRPEISARHRAWVTIFKEKMRLMEHMGLTPKSRAQIGTTIAKDASTFAAELVTAYRDLVAVREEAARGDRTAGKALPLADDPGQASSAEHGVGDLGPDNGIESVSEVGPASTECVPPVGTPDGTGSDQGSVTKPDAQASPAGSNKQYGNFRVPAKAES